MTLDIRGGLKNTLISSNKYVFIEELLSNAVDSYLIRRNSDPGAPTLSISISIDFFNTELLQGDTYDVEISCTDNGYGFGPDQIRAFVTKDSTYKDYLDIQGIGKCKGAGRVQYFHFFRKLNIESIVNNANIRNKIKLDIPEGAREISEDSFVAVNHPDGDASTRVRLVGLTEKAYTQHFDARSLKVDLSARRVRDYLYVAFMQKFIVLKNILGDFQVSVSETGGDNEGTEYIRAEDLPEPVSIESLPIICSHGKNTSNKQLRVTRYSLPESRLSDSQHEVALCANAALVYSLTKYFLKNPRDRSRPLDGAFNLLLVESDFLEDRVNEQRDGFNIPKECTSTDDIDGEISLYDIVDSLEDYVFGILTPRDFDRDALISSTEEQFGISRYMLNQVNIKVRYSDTEENIAKRVLRKYQDEIVKETWDIYSMKQDLLQLDPRSSDFRDKVSEISWKYTSTIRKMDMANLSQLIVRRSSMLEVLKRAVEMTLTCQANGSGRNENEKILHNVFFPMGTDSTENADHDIWILNEEYHYFEYISSDKSLASIPWRDEDKIFSPDIDASLEELFKKNNAEHRLKRPDIAIFNQEGAAIIIEFKAPGVALQDHIPDIVQYARLLAAKSGGKIKKFYGYLIGDCLDETRLPPEFERFPSGLGYFNTSRVKDLSSGAQYGELYTEVLFYSQFIDRAEKRLKIYKEKINLPI